jgi:hypothetical protein
MAKVFVSSELSSMPLLVDVPDPANPGPDLVVTPLGLRMRRDDEAVQSAAERETARAIGAELRARIPPFESSLPHPFLIAMQVAGSDRRRGEPRRSSAELLQLTGFHDLSPAALDVARQELRHVYDQIFDLPERIRVFCKRLVRALSALPELPATDQELRRLLIETLPGPNKASWISALHQLRENLEQQFSDAMEKVGYELRGRHAWVLKHVSWPWD